MTANSKTLTIKQWLGAASRQLNQFASGRLDSELLAGFVLSKPRTWLHAHPKHELTTSEQYQLNALLQRRLDHEPIAYILGEKEFYGRTFAVNSSLLVPRPESEAFIDIVRTVPEKQRCIDIGTGSGILAITTALEQSSWSVTATDVSPAALKIAQKNAQKLDAINLVFKVQDLLSNDNAHYDVVLANLPYVPETMRGKADIAHEPDIALFADHDGLALYEKLFLQVNSRTQKPQHILTESLQEQHADLERLAKNADYTLKKTQGLVQHFIHAA